MTNQESLIEKIRKLNAKANDKSVTEAEAALYAQKVAQLLQEHNLTEAAIQVKEDVEEVGEARIYNSKTGDTWCQTMAGAVARLYFCDIYLNRLGQNVKIAFVGKPHNVEVATSMTLYLIKTIGRLANEYARSPAAISDWNYTFTRARNGFERGAGMRMYERLAQMKREQTANEPQRSATGTPSNLPALYQDESMLVKAYMSKIGLRAGRGGGVTNSGQHAAHGRAAANSISLNSQVGSTSSRMLR